MAKTVISSLNIKITGDASQLGKATRAAQGAVRRFGVDVETSNKSLRRQTQFFGENSRAIARYVQRLLTIYAAIRAIQSVSGFFKSSIQLAGDYEAAERRLTGVLRSAEAAKKLLKELEEFGEATPFDLENLIKSTSQLAPFFGPDEIIATLRTLGDVAAGSGIEIEELTRIYVQSAAEQKVLSRDIKQFASNAKGSVPILKALAQAMGIAETQVFKFAEEGKISFADLQRALVLLTEQGGVFQGQMKLLGDSGPGAIERYRDEVAGLKREIGAGLLPTVTEIANKTQRWVEKLRSAEFAGDSLRETFKDVGDTLIKATNNGLQGILAWQQAIVRVDLAYRRLVKIAFQTGNVIAPSEQMSIALKLVNADIRELLAEETRLNIAILQLRNSLDGIGESKGLDQSALDGERLSDHLSAARRKAMDLKQVLKGIEGIAAGSDEDILQRQAQRFRRTGRAGLPPIERKPDIKEERRLRMENNRLMNQLILEQRRTTRATEKIKPVEVTEQGL